MGAMTGSATASEIAAIDQSKDTDLDLWGNEFEIQTGSNPNDVTSTPETIGGPERFGVDEFAKTHLTQSGNQQIQVLQPGHPLAIDSCRDGLDNDGDGTFDRADDPGNTNPDSGCDLPEEHSLVFPPAQSIVVPSLLATNDIRVQTDGNGLCTVDFISPAPTVLKVDNPVSIGGGLMEQDMHVAALQGTGISAVVASNAPIPPPSNRCIVGPDNSNPPTFTVPPFRSAVTTTQADDNLTVPPLVECPAHTATPSASPGCFRDTNADPGTDFPAKAYIDESTSAYNATADSNDPTPVNGHPLEGMITQLPNYCGATCDPFPDHVGNDDCLKSDDGQAGTCITRPPPSFVNPAVDHMAMYNIKAPKFTKTTVQLQDEFYRYSGANQADPSPHTVDVIKPRTLAAPVVKTPPGGSVSNPDGFLKCYSIKQNGSKFNRANHQIGDQFGSKTVTLIRPEQLCTPAKKDAQATPTGLNNYECYRAKSLTLQSKRDIGLSGGAFADSPEAQTSKLRMLCAPVKVAAGAGADAIQDPDAFLACYSVSKTAGANAIGVTLDGRFGVETPVKVSKPRKFCNPAVRYRPGVHSTDYF